MMTAFATVLAGDWASTKANLLGIKSREYAWGSDSAVPADMARLFAMVCLG